MRTGKTTKLALPLAHHSVPAEHLRDDAEIALYIEEMLADGDVRAVPVALRTVADALGGMSALAEKTGLSRETLYRTLSDKGNLRLDTLAAILAAFELRLSVLPILLAPFAFGAISNARRRHRESRTLSNCETLWKRSLRGGVKTRRSLCCTIASRPIPLFPSYSGARQRRESCWLVAKPAMPPSSVKTMRVPQ
ncbi:MAG: addiction module antidote protein [Gammaproteobacteria bacterium]